MEQVRLQVRDITVSARFYNTLLGHEAQVAGDHHAVFVSDNMRLELSAVPAALMVARQVDIVMTDAERIVSTYETLWDACARLPQIPTDLGFGLGFVALDPDGHCLRVFCPNEAMAA